MSERNGGDVGRPPATPRWVKVLVIGAAVTVALVLLLMLASGGAHGPGRHGAPAVFIGHPTNGALWETLA